MYMGENFFYGQFQSACMPGFSNERALVIIHNDNFLMVYT